jgi:hypothetical protein
MRCVTCGVGIGVAALGVADGRGEPPVGAAPTLGAASGRFAEGVPSGDPTWKITIVTTAAIAVTAETHANMRRRRVMAGILARVRDGAVAV